MFVSLENKYKFILVLFSPQKHRTVEAGGDLWKSFGPTPLPKQGHLELVVQEAFEDLNSLQATWVTAQSTWHWKKRSLMFRWTLLCLCSQPLALPQDTTEKSLASSSVYPPFRYCYTLMNSPLGAFSFLCYPSSRYEGGWSLPWGPGTANVRLVCMSLAVGTDNVLYTDGLNR